MKFPGHTVHLVHGVTSAFLDLCLVTAVHVCHQSISSRGTSKWTLHHCNHSLFNKLPNILCELFLSSSSSDIPLFSMNERLDSALLLSSPSVSCWEQSKELGSSPSRESWPIYNAGLPLLTARRQWQPQCIQGGQWVHGDLLPYQLQLWPFPITSINRNDLLSAQSQ